MPKVGIPFTSESDSRVGRRRRRVDIPAIAPLFIGHCRAQVCAARRHRDSSRSLPSAVTFHTGVTYRSERFNANVYNTVTKSRDSAEHGRGKSPDRERHRGPLLLP